METYLLSVFISTAGHRILSVFISTAEQRIARAMNELARIGDVRSVFVFVFTSLYTKLKNNTVLLIQYCSYHLPLKNSTVLLLT